MADKLIVKDFGPIREAEMDIKKTTVLIGPQGSGKSTLAKLVALCRDKDWMDLIMEKSSPINLLDYGIQNYITEPSYYSFNAKYFNHVYQHKVTRRSPNENYPEQEVIKVIKAKSDILYSNKVFELMNLLQRPIYVPAERILFALISQSFFSIAVNKIPLPESIAQFGSKFEGARQKLTEFRSVLQNVVYKFENGKDVIIVDDNITINLAESASGFQALIPLQMVVEGFFEEGILSFIIEEPELNLYPTTQKNLVYYLADRCTKSENELMMTTHSPYVLAALNNLIFAYKVAHNHPEKAAEVEKVIPRASWLNPDEFAAYFVADGTVRSIINPKTGLISENELDNVSDEIGDEFDSLMDIYRNAKNEKVH
ncbi:AAA family ATPase [Runella sp.]|uniref:AAA family ATPase n=1 Tax=Runella sp. TaxID=1960881 RepID=UPI003D10FF81